MKNYDQMTPDELNDEITRAAAESYSADKAQKKLHDYLCELLDFKEATQ